MSDDDIRSLVEETDDFVPTDVRNAGQASAPRRLMIGSDVEIAGCVADELRSQLGDIIFSDGDFWRYLGRYWAPIEQNDLRHAVHRYDGARYQAQTTTGTIKLTKTHIDSIIHEMGSMLAHPDFFDERPAGVNCATGFIRFARDGSPSLEPHHPEHRCRNVLAGQWVDLPVLYDLNFDGSLLRRLIEGVFRGDPDAQAKTALIQEIAGTAALGYATQLRQPMAAILVGATAENGKSQILDLFRGLLPDEAIASIPAGKMGDERFLPGLIGKHLNAADELSGATAIASEAFKAVVTGEPVTGRDVYHSAVTFRPGAQHVFCTNTLPSFTGGMDRGVQRRLLVILFNRVIPKEERIERIGQRIGEEEADLLLAWAVCGASRVIRQREFTVPVSSKETLRRWLRSADPVVAWAEAHVTVADRASTELGETRMKSRDAYSHFKSFAIAEGFRENHLPALNGFVQRLTAHVPAIAVKHTRTGNWLTGLKIEGYDQQAEKWGRPLG